MKHGNVIYSCIHIRTCSILYILCVCIVIDTELILNHACMHDLIIIIRFNYTILKHMGRNYINCCVSSVYSTHRRGSQETTHCSLGRSESTLGCLEMCCYCFHWQQTIQSQVAFRFLWSMPSTRNSFQCLCSGPWGFLWTQSEYQN